MEYFIITILGAAGVAGAVVYAALLEVTTPKVALLIQLVVPVMLAVRYVVCTYTYVCIRDKVFNMKTFKDFYVFIHEAGWVS